MRDRIADVRAAKKARGEPRSGRGDPEIDDPSVPRACRDDGPLDEKYRAEGCGIPSPRLISAP